MPLISESSDCPVVTSPPPKADCRQMLSRLSKSMRDSLFSKTIPIITCSASALSREVSQVSWMWLSLMANRVVSKDWWYCGIDVAKAKSICLWIMVKVMERWSFSNTAGWASMLRLCNALMNSIFRLIFTAVRRNRSSQHEEFADRYCGPISVDQSISI